MMSPEVTPQLSRRSRELATKTGIYGLSKTSPRASEAGDGTSTARLTVRSSSSAPRRRRWQLSRQGGPKSDQQFGRHAISPTGEPGDYLPRHVRACSAYRHHVIRRNANAGKSSVARENFTAERLMAIVTVTGRLIAPMSRRPENKR